MSELFKKIYLERALGSKYLPKSIERTRETYLKHWHDHYISPISFIFAYLFFEQIKLPLILFNIRSGFIHEI